MQNILVLKERFKKLADLFNPIIDTLDSGNLTCESLDLTKEVENLNIYNTPDKLKEVTIRLSNISKTMESFKDVSLSLKDMEDLLKAYENETDESILTELESDMNKMEDNINFLVIFSLLDNPNDKLNAIVKIRANDLSLENADFVKEIYNMIIGFSKRNEWTIALLDFEEIGDGYKNISFVVNGENAYGLLKCFNGTHKELKQSEYNENNNRHSVFASVIVIPEIINDEEIILKDDEIKIETYRSSGAGGQHVNTTDSAVRITHIPSGIVVTCQDERSQTQNKETAKKVLLSKLVELKTQSESQKEGNLNSLNDAGNPIITYTFYPSESLKDNRTNYESKGVENAFAGELNEIIFSYLRWLKG